MRHRRQLALVRHHRWRTLYGHVRDRRQRHQLPGGPAVALPRTVSRPMPSGVNCSAGGDFEDDLIAVDIGIDGRDLLVAIGGIERLADGSDRHAEPAGGIAIDLDHHFARAALIIRRHIFKARVSRAAWPRAWAQRRKARPCRPTTACTGSCSTSVGRPIAGSAECWGRPKCPGCPTASCAAAPAPLRPDRVRTRGFNGANMRPVFDPPPPPPTKLLTRATAGSARTMLRDLVLLGEHLFIADIGRCFGADEDRAGVLGREEALGHHA